MTEALQTDCTRQRIVDAADRLFYQAGFAHSSFADIATAVGISRGNFYHHFKTKDAILAAVIEHRLEKVRQIHARWEEEATTPDGRLRRFINILIDNQDPIMAYGCPVGTLCVELAKLDHTARPEANAIFTLFRTWLASQFAALGHAPQAADRLAMTLLARSQGVSTLAASIGDTAFVRQEVAQMEAWLDALPHPAKENE